MKISPKQIEKAMARLGMQAIPVKADEVIIRTGQKEIVIRQPQVTKMAMAGQVSWQIVGPAEEREADKRPELTEEDINLVMAQTGAGREHARQALIESGGDLAAAILSIKKEKLKT